MVEEKRCWFCNRTAKEELDYEEDGKNMDKEDALLEIPTEKNSKKYKHQYSLCTLNKNIFICTMCNGLIQMIMQHDLENYSVSGKIEVEGLKLELD